MISYNEKTDEISINVSMGNFTLPPSIQPQFKLDTNGYFISYILNKILIRIPLTDEEYKEISLTYIDL